MTHFSSVQVDAGRAKPKYSPFSKAATTLLHITYTFLSVGLTGELWSRGGGILSVRTTCKFWWMAQEWACSQSGIPRRNCWNCWQKACVFFCWTWTQETANLALCGKILCSFNLWIQKCLIAPISARFDRYRACKNCVVVGLNLLK